MRATLTVVALVVAASFSSCAQHHAPAVHIEVTTTSTEPIVTTTTEPTTTTTEAPPPTTTAAHVAPARASRSTPPETAPPVVDDDVRSTGRAMMLERWGDDQWPCLEELWTHESEWNPDDDGGIPQAKPADKMASEGDDWRTNPVTQIRWGLGYIAGRYGTPCHALSSWWANPYPHWY